ncbi:Protoporphyrinogen oxidase [Fasciolopsis buskii]|uniref:Protoporphyrinogen oxidase n=1 Tax=Fasciolopsis buskii TaxID=27845 RepID=A0A8E0VMM4_9TREM|nr:Protoporphyrinogen oxidase [Fasciolopsis buski]
MTTRLPHYCVVGGGICGLTTAYFISLLKPPGSYRLTLLEATARCGGWIHSVRNPNTGAVYDLGPHSARAFAPNSSLLLRVALSLNLKDSILWMLRDADSSRSQLYVGDKLVPISPLGFRATEPFTRSPLGLITRRLFSKRPPSQRDWSVDEFLRTRLDDEFADYLGSAMMRGIYAGDSRELSARACLSRLVEAEELGPNMILGLLRQARMELKGPRFRLPPEMDRQLPSSKSVAPRHAMAWSLSSGMQTLTDALYYRLRDLGPHSAVLVNSPAFRALPSGSGRLRVYWSPDNRSAACLEDVDALFLCCPSYRTADILRDMLSPDIVIRLDKSRIPWANVAVAALELEGPALPAVRAFGHLVPRPVDANVLGVIYDSVAFPKLDSPHGTVRYTVIIKPYPQWLELNATDPNVVAKVIESKALDVLREHLGLTIRRVVDRHVGIYHDSIPQYPLGHLDNVKALRKAINACGMNGIHLVGYSYDGVGIGDVVHSGLKAVCAELGVAI